MNSLCHVSTKVKGECDVCHRTGQALHMPEEVHGFYCAQCCPICSRREQVQFAA
jgi:hypothetical protein